VPLVVPANVASIGIWNLPEPFPVLVNVNVSTAIMPIVTLCPAGAVIASNGTFATNVVTVFEIVL